jgi:hypothetical protein
MFILKIAMWILFYWVIICGTYKLIKATMSRTVKRIVKPVPEYDLVSGALLPTTVNLPNDVICNTGKFYNALGKYDPDYFRAVPGAHIWNKSCLSLIPKKMR